MCGSVSFVPQRAFFPSLLFSLRERERERDWSQQPGTSMTEFELKKQHSKERAGEGKGDVFQSMCMCLCVHLFLCGRETEKERTVSAGEAVILKALLKSRFGTELCSSFSLRWVSSPCSNQDLNMFIKIYSTTLIVCFITLKAALWKN